MNATWFKNELFSYTPPDCLVMDRAKRLWHDAYQKRKIENLENLFNLEIDPIWEEINLF
jgi:hypothetical protein